MGAGHREAEALQRKQAAEMRSGLDIGSSEPIPPLKKYTQLNEIGTQPITARFLIPMEDALKFASKECGRVFILQSVDVMNGRAILNFLPGNGMAEWEGE